MRAGRGRDSRRFSGLPRCWLGRGVWISEATSLRARFIGLAFLDGIPSGQALLLRPCRGVHTFGMRFPLDVIFLDERGQPLRTEFGVPGRRMLACRRARSVLEARAGEGELFLSALERRTLSLFNRDARTPNPR